MFSFQTMIQRIALFCAIFLLANPLVTPGYAQDVKQVFEPFDKILDRHLEEHTVAENGLITAFRYQEALRDDKTSQLRNKQIKMLQNYKPDQLDSKWEANAFWINSYNFFMIEYLLNNPQDGQIVSSVRDYGSFINPYWVFTQKFIDIGGEKYSLDQIEKEILLGEEFARKGWWDARVHFVVNCASVGCPPLRQDAYTAENMEHYFEENTHRALNTPRQLRVDGKTLEITQLFEWYEDDFLKEADTIEQWLIENGTPSVRKKVERTNGIDYIEYDWSLNRPQNFHLIN